MIPKLAIVFHVKHGKPRASGDDPGGVILSAAEIP